MGQEKRYRLGFEAWWTVFVLFEGDSLKTVSGIVVADVTGVEIFCKVLKEVPIEVDHGFLLLKTRYSRRLKQ